MKHILEIVVNKNQTFAGLHKVAKFLMEIPLRDYTNMRKLLLMGRVYPYTMVGYRRLSQIYEYSSLIEQKGIKGAFVECGVWKGGCAAVMAYVVDRARSNRKVWLFDSFEGLPEPTVEDGKEAEVYAKGSISGKLSSIQENVSPVEDVRELFFTVLHLQEKNVSIRKGWFQDTLPEARDEIGPIAILRLDGDWYESTKCCLENLYDNVIAGGYIVLDDYWFWEGCKKAVDSFLAERNISARLVTIDEAGAYFQKP